MTENHYAKVCHATKDKYKKDFLEKRQQQQGQRQPQKIYSKQAHEAANQLEDDVNEPEGDYIVHSFSAYTIEDDTERENDKFFTWLPISVTPEKTVKMLIQVDSAATCNTLPYHLYRQLALKTELQKSNARIKPYSGSHIRP